MLGVGLLAVILGVVFIVFDLVYNDGKLMAPLDDAYIHLQYAAQIGQGHFLQWNTGDPISTGASSLLYVLVLGAAYAIGFQAGLFEWFAVGFGILCFAIAAAATFALGRRLVGRWVGLWAGVLVAVSGPLLWGATSGMEVGMAAMLFVLSVLFLVRESDSGRFVVTPIVAAFLALARVEGMIFGGFLWIAMIWILIARRRRIGVVRGVLVGLWTLLPLAVGAGELIFFKIATDTFSANGIAAKSAFRINPVLYPAEAVETTMSNMRNLVELFGGLSSRGFAMPGAIFLFALGLAYLAVRAPRWRPMVLAVGLGFVVVFGATSTLVSSQVHHYRYVQPLLPLFLLFMVIGCHGVTRLASNERARVIALHSVLSVALLFSLVMAPVWATRLGRESATIRDTDVSVAHWVNATLPPNAIIGVKDVGAVTYFGGHRVIDMIGLATDNFAEASDNGIGSLYEALRHLPPDQRPSYLVTYDSGPGPSMAGLRDAGLLGAAPVATFDVTSPHTDETLMVPFHSLDVYKVDWSRAGSGDHQQVPGQLRDYLNVGDLTSEHAHDYQPESANVGFQPYTQVRMVAGVVDSGRDIQGGEQFTAHNLVPGRPLTITARIAVNGSPAPMANPASVLVNGRPAGGWTRAATPTASGWSVETFTVPGNLITGTTAQIEIAAPHQPFNPYPKYTTFGYWLSQ